MRAKLNCLDAIIHTIFGGEMAVHITLKTPYNLVLALGQLFWLFFSLLYQKSCKEHWSRQIYGEIIVLPLPYYGPKSAHWTIQKLRMVPITNAIIVLEQLGCEGLETALCFSWDVSCVTPWQWDLFVGHHLGLNQLLLMSTDRGLDCFLITVSFQQLSWLSMPFCKIGKESNIILIS